MPEKSQLLLIDGHTHCFTPAVVDTLVGVMEQLDLQAFNVCGICAGSYKRMSQNALCLLLKLMHPGKVYACGGLSYKLPGQSRGALDPRGQAERLMSLGFDGIKMIEGKPTAYKEIGIPLNDSVYDDYYGWLESRQVPVVFHVADPESFWDREKVPPHFLERGWCYDDGTYPAKELLYEQIDDILARFAKLRVIFAHFYFLSADIERAGEFLERWPTVSFDITPGMEMYGNFSQKPHEWSEFFAEYADRIIFGTDNVCSVDEGGLAGSIEKIRNMRRFLETTDEFTFGRYEVCGLGLSGSVLGKIYHGNFERHFGGQPKAVDKDGVLTYCHELAAQAETMPEKAEVLPGLQQIADAVERLTS